MADSTLLVGSPTPAEIERAITRPAARAGLVLEDGLAETMVDEAGNEPGLLPLLSVALTQLWEQRTDERLTYAGYVGVGGIAGAIGTLAEAVWSDALGRRPVGGPGAPAEARRARGRRRRRTTPGAAGGDRGPVAAWSPPRPGTPRRRPVAHGRGRSRRGRPRGAVPRVAAAAGLARRRCCGARGPASARGRGVGVGERGTRAGRAVAGHQAVVRPGGRRLPTRGDHPRRAGLPRRRPGGWRTPRSAPSASARPPPPGRTAGSAGCSSAPPSSWRWRSSPACSRCARAATAEESATRAEASAISADARRLAANALNEDRPALALLQAVEATQREQSPETYGALLTLLTRSPDIVTRFRIAERLLRISGERRRSRGLPRRRTPTGSTRSTRSPESCSGPRRLPVAHPVGHRGRRPARRLARGAADRRPGVDGDGRPRRPDRRGHARGHRRGPDATWSPRRSPGWTSRLTCSAATSC